jgi:hypothetical protein
MFIRLYSLFILSNVKEHSFYPRNAFLRTSKQVDEISRFQQSEEDCGAACLASTAKFYGQIFQLAAWENWSVRASKGRLYWA